MKNLKIERKGEDTMDFFKKMNAAKNANGAKRTNPLLAKKKAAAKAAETVIKEETEKAAPVKKVNPLMMKMKKAKEAKAAAAEEAAKEKTTVKAEAVAEETEAKTEAPKKAEDAVAKTAEATKAKETKEEVKAKESKAEEKPVKKTRKRRTHAEVVAEKEAKAAAQKAKEEAKAAEASNVPAVADDSDDQGILVSDYREVNAFETSMSPEEAAGVVNQGLTSDSFRAYQREIIGRLRDIKITPDMNPGAIKYTLAELDGLNVEVGINLTEKKQLINGWTNKEYGVLTAYRVSHLVGKNEGERKRNAFAALSSANINGEQVNVLALVTSANMQLEFFQGISDIIKAKREMLITMSSQVKLENSSMMMQDATA